MNKILQLLNYDNSRILNEGGAQRAQRKRRVIQWSLGGHTMVTQWSLGGHTIVTRWSYNGHTMVIQ
ncbi:MAG: hypothetical protein HXX13_11045 [Bacteroidetes bacterium]|nr:hypothetical protein [Bacteroidota bacterium]